jgi:MFS family permease
MANRNPNHSLRGLDWVNFFMADVATGVGPFLAIYLTATRHWDPASVGMVVAAQSIASVAAQVPAGWLVDNSSRKKCRVIFGAVLVAAGCMAIVLAPNVVAEVGVQIVIGLSDFSSGDCRHCSRDRRETQVIAASRPQ